MIVVEMGARAGRSKERFISDMIVYPFATMKGLRQKKLDAKAIRLQKEEVCHVLFSTLVFKQAAAVSLFFWSIFE